MKLTDMAFQTWGVGIRYFHLFCILLSVPYLYPSIYWYLIGLHAFRRKLDISGMRLSHILINITIA